MCYAIPGRLVELKGGVGVVDYFGEKKRVLTGFLGAKTGDYVYAQAGVLVRKIPREKAIEVLKTWEDAFFKLKRIDRERSKNTAKISNAPQKILRILQKANQNKKLTKKELSTLLAINERKQLELVLAAANNIRQKEHGNASCVHGIIEFSNICRMGCFYCGLRKGSNIKRYRLAPDRIVRSARYAAARLNFKALVLQSGEDAWYDEDALAQMVSRIKRLGVLIFLSIGQRSEKTYKRLFDEGAQGALLRFETSNADIFNRLRPGTSLNDRLNLIRFLKRTGFILATGFLTGLPGELNEDVVNNILLTKSLEPDMYSFGPFIPADGTPLGGAPCVSKDDVLKVTALARLADRDANILVTTATETLDEGAKGEALMAGANSLMINVTPAKVRGLYRIYADRAGAGCAVKDNIDRAVKLLYSLGRAPLDLGTKW